MVTLEGLLGDIIGFTLLAVFLVAVGWVAGRILGVKRGVWRALVAGMVGYAAGLILVDVQFGPDAQFNDLGDVAKLGLGFVGYVLLVTMLASIVLDVILRPREKRGSGLPHPIRALNARLATVGRLRDIATAARANGLIGRRVTSARSLSTPEGARALRLTLEQSGGMLVKFGQIASTREDLLPETITSELANLRTSVPPLPADVVRSVVERELGAPLEQLFAEFDPTALAAASIGVTHRAVLPDGRRVIVKVQRPGIDAVVARDGQVLKTAARQLERRSESAARLGVSALADELMRGITEELDFTREAANNAAMLRTRSNDPGIALPVIHRDLTTRRVLVMDEVRGVPVSDAAAVEATGVPRTTLAQNLFRSFLAQVLQDGVYHADPHPGNVLIDADGVMWFIDFGAVGHIDPVTLEALQQMAMGFMLRDPSLLARALRRMAGQQGDGLDMNALEFDLGVVLTDVAGGGFDPTALQAVVRVLNRHGVHAPSALTVLARAALTLEGTLRSIDRDFRMADRAQQELTGIVGGPELEPREALLKEAARALPSLRGLPQLTEDVALQARAGRLTLRTERYEGPDGRRVDRWLDDVVFASLGMVGLVGSALLLVGAGLAGNAEVSVYLRVIGFSGLVLSTAMQMRVVAQILSRRPRRTD